MAAATPLGLRQVRPEDKWRLWEWRNSPHIRRVSTNDAEIPRDVHERWFEAHFPEMRDRTVVLESNGEPIGWYQVDSWDPETQSAGWGYGLAEDANAFGVGAILPLLGLAHGFERTGARTMRGTVLELNGNVISMFARFGIPSVGTLPGELVREDGTVTGLVGYEVDVNEWPAILERGLAILPERVGAMLTEAMAAPLGD